MITNADPKLTKADFDAEPWEQTLAAAKEPTCIEYCEPLLASIEKCKAAGKDRSAQVYALLHDTAALRPSWGSTTKPFGPVNFGSAGRSASLDDFGRDEAAVLSDVAPDIVDPEFRARVSDVAWVLGRDHKLARLAIPAYVESAIRLEGAARHPCFIARFQRAIQLALMVGRGESALLASVTSKIEKCIQKRISGETKYTSADLMRLLVQAEFVGTTDYADISEALAIQAEKREDWNVARVYWGCKAEWHRLAKDETQYRDACVKSAETYVGAAESALKRTTPSHGACAGLLKRAVEALRKIPETRGRVEELHKRILNEQEQCAACETITKSFSADISDIVNATMAQFRSRPLDQLLLNLGMIGASPLVVNLRSSAEKSMKSSIWRQILRAEYNTKTGKRMAEKPSALDGNPQDRDLCLKAEMMGQIKWHRGLIVSGGIKPALQVINAEHFVRLEDLEFLVRDNPFVPTGREPIFIRGLFAGLSGDFLFATHLLVPQVENSIRYLVYNYAGDPRTSKLRDDLKQPERDLNELLYRGDVKRILGEDLIFDMQSLLIEPGFGANLRNELAHGLLDADQFFTDDIVYAWWLIWRICCIPSLIRIQPESGIAGQ